MCVCCGGGWGGGGDGHGTQPRFGVCRRPRHAPCDPLGAPSWCLYRTCTGNNVAAQRNYPCDNYLIVYFGDNAAFLNSTGEAVFKEQLYKVGWGLATRGVEAG